MKQEQSPGSEPDPGTGNDRWRHIWLAPRSLSIAGLFVLITMLTFLVGRSFAALLLLPVLLSLVGIRPRNNEAGRIAATGEVMVFNGVVLIMALLLVGFIRDFLLGHPTVVDDAVGFAFTTVHVMLGVGLFLVDYRTLQAKRG